MTRQTIQNLFQEFWGKKISICFCGPRYCDLEDIKSTVELEKEGKKAKRMKS